MKTMYVYILECSDTSYYVGVTNDLERRLLEHQSGMHEDSYTATRLPLKLVYHEQFDDPNAAIEREKRLKKWSRAKKEALIKANEQELVNLSKKHFLHP